MKLTTTILGTLTLTAFLSYAVLAGLSTSPSRSSSGLEIGPSSNGIVAATCTRPKCPWLP